MRLLVQPSATKLSSLRDQTVEGGCDYTVVDRVCK